MQLMEAGTSFPRLVIRQSCPQLPCPIKTIQYVTV